MSENSTDNSTVIMALRNGEIPLNKGYWTEKEKEELTSMFHRGIGVSEMALYFRRSEEAVANQIRVLGLREQCRTTYKKKHESICPTALFYIGETVGRVANGFITDRFGDRNMIRVGVTLMFVGIAMVLVPINEVALIGLVIVGLGAAPVYPCIIHATPSNFGRENSQALVGIQMASAYMGTTLMPPLFGLIAQHISVGLYPFYLLIFAGLMLAMTELLNRAVSRKK